MFNNINANKTQLLKFSSLCFFSLLVVSILTSGCKRDDRPSGIIPEEKMKYVLMDMHLVESRSFRIPKDDSAKSVTKASYEFIFKKYGIDTAMLNKSMNYYLSHPAILDNMYEQMIDSLSKKQSQVSKEERPIPIENQYNPTPSPGGKNKRDSIRRVRDSVIRNNIELKKKKNPIQ